MFQRIGSHLAGFGRITEHCGREAMPLSERRTWIKDGSASDEYNGPKYFCSVTLK
jgi:hypothetical protein